MKQLGLALAFVCMTAALSFGRLELGNYVGNLLGFMDDNRTVQVYAFAKIDKSEQDRVRSVPHQEVIAALGFDGSPAVSTM